MILKFKNSCLVFFKKNYKIKINLKTSLRIKIIIYFIVINTRSVCMHA